jgi:catechol 2,3-dioxygenase
MIPLKLGHVHLKVRDLDRSVAFYTELLGLSVTEQVGNYAFLGDGNLHHVVALQGLGIDAPRPARDVTGLYHVAFEVPDEVTFDDRVHKARELARLVQTVDHGISWAAYFNDPDGNGIEIYLDRRSVPGGRSLWA